ncbi:MAG: HGGxSTG domain-containing protein, partial [Candidatus Hydrogenedentota bacterium]
DALPIIRKVPSGRTATPLSGIQEDITMSDTITQSTRTTQRGTPCSKKWEPDWCETVEATEDKLNRRCCGAHAPDGMPCQLQSNHKNGRCRFHGGIDGIGAPKGNTNAQLHGLYSRRLRQCGSHCPQWKTCLFAGKDVERLDPKKRPICAYEQQEYDLLNKLDEQSNPKKPGYVDPNAHPHPHLSHVASLRENLHMLQVMITRANVTLSFATNTQEVSVTSKNYNMTTTKPSASLQALQILTREYHCTLNTLKRFVDHYQLPTPNPVLSS